MRLGNLELVCWGDSVAAVGLSVYGLNPESGNTLAAREDAHAVASCKQGCASERERSRPAALCRTNEVTSWLGIAPMLAHWLNFHYAFDGRRVVCEYP